MASILPEDAEQSSRLRPPVSIIVEWENADRIGVARARRMLAQLFNQLTETETRSTPGSEVIVMFDQDSVERESIAALLAEAAGANAWPAEMRLEPVSIDGYYDQKNYGSTLARNDILVFLDSDVVPEPGWLAGLRDAMERPEVDLVCGSTFIEHDDFYSRAVALTWFFPVRDRRDDLVAARRFFANNLAVRRALFSNHPFPESGQFRGQCALLAEELMADGYTIWRARGSRVAHPPPDNARHFVVRALWHGHDDRIHKARITRASFGDATRQLRSDLSRAFRSIRAHHKQVGLGAAGAAGAGALALAYYGLKYSAYLVALRRPGALAGLLRRVEI